MSAAGEARFPRKSPSEPGKILKIHPSPPEQKGKAAGSAPGIKLRLKPLLTPLTPSIPIFPTGQTSEKLDLGKRGFQLGGGGFFPPPTSDPAGKSRCRESHPRSPSLPTSLPLPAKLSQRAALRFFSSGFSKRFPFFGGIGMGTHRAGGRGNRPGESRWERPWNRRLPQSPLPSIGGRQLWQLLSQIPSLIPSFSRLPDSGRALGGSGRDEGNWEEGQRERLGMGTASSGRGTL